MLSLVACFPAFLIRGNLRAVANRSVVRWCCCGRPAYHRRGGMLGLVSVVIRCFVMHPFLFVLSNVRELSSTEAATFECELGFCIFWGHGMMGVFGTCLFCSLIVPGRRFSFYSGYISRRRINWSGTQYHEFLLFTYVLTREGSQ